MEQIDHADAERPDQEASSQSAAIGGARDQRVARQNGDRQGQKIHVVAIRQSLNDECGNERGERI